MTMGHGSAVHHMVTLILGRRRALAGLVAVACGMFGCEEDAAPEFTFPSAWKSAGLEVASFDAMKDAPLGQGKCWSGKVARLDTVICRYHEPEQAKAARAEGLGYVGAHTGVSLNSGPWLIVITDRDQVDPTGKDINRIATIFLNHLQVKPKPKVQESGADEGATKPETEAKPLDKESKKADQATGDKP